MPLANTNPVQPVTIIGGIVIINGGGGGSVCSDKRSDKTFPRRLFGIHRTRFFVFPQIFSIFDDARTCLLPSCLSLGLGVPDKSANYIQITFDFNQILISYVFSLIYKIILLRGKFKFIYYYKENCLLNCFSLELNLCGQSHGGRRPIRINA